MIILTIPITAINILNSLIIRSKRICNELFHRELFLFMHDIHIFTEI